MTKSHLSYETVERWRKVVLAIGTVSVITGVLLGFPFILGLFEGQGSGASHEVGSDTARTLAFAPSSLSVPGIIFVAVGVLLVLIAHYVLR